MVAASGWALTWFADFEVKSISPAAADHAWYVCAVLALCPPMAVLGSRRPGTRVWTWFIVFPMLLALCWPIMALRLQGSELRGLQLETPQLIAFGLVLVMGVGNYCGTKYTLPALIYGASILAIVVSCSTIAPGWCRDRTATRFWSMSAMALAISVSAQSTRPAGRTRFDRLWLDFFDTFGIVWGRRIQDRVNFLARKERWPMRLELDGFFEIKRLSPADLASKKSIDDDLVLLGNAAMESRMEHTFRWLLRRFVDPSWINERLESENAINSTDLTVDS